MSSCETSETANARGSSANSKGIRIKGLRCVLARKLAKGAGGRLEYDGELAIEDINSRMDGSIRVFLELRWDGRRESDEDFVVVVEPDDVDAIAAG